MENNLELNNETIQELNSLTSDDLMSLYGSISDFIAYLDSSVVTVEKLEDESNE